MNALKSQLRWPDLVRRRLTHWHPTTCQGLVIRHHPSTMRLRSSAFLWLWTLRYVSALEESEAGVIDWHKELVGVPLTDSTKALPMFIRSDPSSPTKKTGMAVATKSNVLAVLNPGSTGNVVWRREFDQSEGRILQYKTHRDGTSLSNATVTRRQYNS
ncbi:hypothetical protein AG1IA_10164 [Rhizoctonia solani AG-1 IA]|uniref:Uncharacterized protein n=1 Tax=Thanatephorus cucumeris (strain AG1-IA) TaxID=983506 RepID=L8WCC6_THACA|nr:hypothetical protein AG1IA_10164 [Rhizoctonia solani AG-1 IA]